MRKSSGRLGEDKFDPENPKGVPIHDMDEVMEKVDPSPRLSVMGQADRELTYRELLLHRDMPEEKNLQRWWFLQAMWSRDTFGSDQERGPAGPIEHLEKEVQELKKDPTDIMEYVDCMFLILDAARRQGYSFYDVMDGLFLKLKQNVMRKWNKPSTDRAVEHVRRKFRKR